MTYTWETRHETIYTDFYLIKLEPLFFILTSFASLSTRNVATAQDLSSKPSNLTHGQGGRKVQVDDGGRKD